MITMVFLLQDAIATAEETTSTPWYGWVVLAIGFLNVNLSPYLLKESYQEINIPSNWKRRWRGLFWLSIGWATILCIHALVFTVAGVLSSGTHDITLEDWLYGYIVTGLVFWLIWVILRRFLMGPTTKKSLTLERHSSKTHSYHREREWPKESDNTPIPSTWPTPNTPTQTITQQQTQTPIVPETWSVVSESGGLVKWVSNKGNRFEWHIPGNHHVFNIAGSSVSIRQTTPPSTSVAVWSCETLRPESRLPTPGIKFMGSVTI